MMEDRGDIIVVNLRRRTRIPLGPCMCCFWAHAWTFGEVMKCMTRICEDVEVLLLRLQLPIYPRWPCWSLIFHFFFLFSFLRTHYLSRPDRAAAAQRIRALRLFEFTECAQCNLWAAEESCATGLFHQTLITVSCSLFNQWCIMSPSHCEHVQPHRPFRYTCIGPHFGLFAACLSFISPADLHLKLWVKKHIKALWETEPRSVLLPLQASVWRLNLFVIGVMISIKTAEICSSIPNISRTKEVVRIKNAGKNINVF